MQTLQIKMIDVPEVQEIKDRRTGRQLHLRMERTSIRIFKKMNLELKIENLLWLLWRNRFFRSENRGWKQYKSRKR
jgi:hypothetical protein